jgi:hypothetical protein
MVLVASVLSLGLSVSGVLFFGTGVPSIVTEAMGLIAVASAFVAICSAEAQFAG